MRVGVISDTHDFLDPRLPVLFAGVDRIIHAGDIGMPWVILELEQIAPVTAVIGNSDTGATFREVELLQLNDRKFLIYHIVDPGQPARPIRDRIIRENPDVVVFGHTHRRYCEIIEGVLYLNPGYAGKPRPEQPRSVAILECDAEGITADFLSLD
ncbi:MAG: YfcE family phosphodiesterase [Verrucomicrobia bacterium]|nr:YfcE family phosphodiesterase [Verrucomicrobiota bacterium]